MAIQGIVLYKDHLQNILAEAVLVPGIPKVEVLGVTKRDEKELSVKLKHWLRLSEIRFPRNKKIVISLNRSFTSQVSGLDLVAWLCLLEMKGRVKNYANQVFSGDYDLLMNRRKESAIDLALKSQSQLHYHKPDSLPKHWHINPSKEIHKKTTLQGKKVLIRRKYNSFDRSFLNKLQMQHNQICERLNKEHLVLENQVNKILYLEIDETSSGDINSLKKFLNIKNDSCTFILFTSLCPCGKRGFTSRMKEPCKYSKAHCLQYIKKLRQLPLHMWDLFWEYEDLIGTNKKLIIETNEKKMKNSLSKANLRLLEQNIEIE